MEMEEAAGSKLIKRFGHDPATKRLRIEFASGGTYEYDDVDAAKMQQFREAETLGKGFHAHIRGQHKHRQV
jgi:hypothetical protein